MKFSVKVNICQLQHVQVVPQVVTLEPSTQVSGVTGNARHVACPCFSGALLQSHEQPSTPTLHVLALAIFQK